MAFNVNAVLPKISIIMPVFNGALYLEQAIQSVIEQNYPNLEFIIIDGGSTDNSLQIIEKYKDQISVVLSENDFGLNHAVNKGILLSTGDYIGWLNSDDYYYENALVRIGDFLRKNPETGLIYGDAAHVDANGNFLSWHEAIPFDKSKLLHVRDYIPCQACFFKRAALAYIGLFDTNLKWCGDWDMWKRFAVSGKFKIEFIDEKIGAWRLHGNTITSGANSSRQMYLRAIENFNSSRKYSEKLLSRIELVQIPFMVVGFLGLRQFLKKIRDKFFVGHVESKN